MKPDIHIFEVFARQRRKDPLAHVGTVTAPNEDLAVSYARSIYNEEPWIEMRVVDRTNFIAALDMEEV